MKGFLILSALFAISAGSSLRFVPIRSFSHDISASGVYSVRHESGDGTILVSESGRPLPIPLGGASKLGSYTFTAPDGKVFTTSYVSDHQGFRPIGDHLPTPPPMPEEIRAMLPTLPKLVEVRDEFIERRPLLVREERPVFFRAPVVVDSFVPMEQIQRDLMAQQAPAPEKTFVQTSEFSMDSSPSRTVVKIGN